MTLTLRIENFDTLEDGGPIFMVVDRRSASVGRKRGMDWVLPDPVKHISGHHFDITYAQGTYLLTDVSTNGTLIEGSPHRLDGPYPLRGGERLLVGRYVISVELRSEAARPVWGELPRMAPPVAEVGPQVDDSLDDIWNVISETPPPLSPRLQVPSRMDGASAAGVSLPGRSAHGAADIQNPGVPHQSPPVAMPPQFTGQPETPLPGFRTPPMSPPVAPPRAPAGHAGTQTPPPGFAPVSYPQPPITAPAPNGFAAAFCEGAGLHPSFAQSVDSEALARTLGRVIRVTTDEMMRMLQDRAKVKQFTRGGERTMRSATGNNPMKFMVDSEQAIEVMFLRARDGFMSGPDGFDNALKDLRAHQMAVFAALQPALAAVLAGLSPEEIEAAETTGNMLGGSRKGRLWDQFVRRWDEKAKAGDHGMLDEFLKAFARAYAGAVSRDI